MTHLSQTNEDQAAVQVEPTAVTTHRPAPMGSRLVAAFLDWLMIGFICVPALPAIAAATSDRLAPWLALLIPWAYFAGFESSTRQATWFQKREKLQVTDIAGGRITLAKASLRFAGKLLILVSMGLGLLPGLISQDSRALDDLLAGTRMVSLSPAPSARTTARPWYRIPGLVYLICYAISVVAIQWWLNLQTHVSSQDIPPNGFKVLVRGPANEGTALKLMTLDTWRQGGEPIGGLELAAATGQGQLPGDANGFDRVKYTIQSGEKGPEVTILIEMEKGGVEYVYRVENQRVIPLTTRSAWPLPWAFLFAFMNSFLLLLPAHYLVRLWEWHRRPA